MVEGLLEAQDAAVGLNVQVRTVLLQAVHLMMAQGRDLAILLRRQALEPGLARVHRKTVTAGRGDRIHEAQHMLVGVDIVDADAMLHGHRDRYRLPHGRHPVGDPLGLGHQARADAAFLNAIAGAADVEVDLVEAVVFGDARALGQGAGIVAPQLQRDRVLLGMKGQQTVAVTVEHGSRGHHFGIEQGVPGDAAKEVAEMPVRAIHHGSHGEGAKRAPARIGVAGSDHGLHRGIIIRRRRKARLWRPGYCARCPAAWRPPAYCRRCV